MKATKGKTMKETAELKRRETAVGAATSALADRLDETLADFARREAFDRVSFVLTIACFNRERVIGATVANISGDDTLAMLKTALKQMETETETETELQLIH
jgi:hypothetical protein